MKRHPRGTLSSLLVSIIYMTSSRLLLKCLMMYDREDYYQEGSNVYKQLDVQEAFRKAVTTWGRWVDANINPQRTHVFFRGYSSTHFRSV